MDRSRIALIIPAFNESQTIADVVAAAGAYGQVIVVDDGSIDETALLAKNSGARVIRHEINKGYDNALDSGFAEAARQGFDVVITLDADGQHDPSLIIRFLHHLDAGADIVLGVRDETPRISEWLFSLYTQNRFGISDPLCGMKAYRMAIYHALGHFDSYQSIGTELMLFAAKHSYRIDQVPFKVRQRHDSPRFGRNLSANWRILRAMALSWGR